MALYPIFLRLDGLRVLVVGAGPVAVRKVKGLADSGAQVFVVAPLGDREMETLPVQWQRRDFAWPDLDGAALVFAATDVRGLNRSIGEECTKRGIWVNIADEAAEGSFHVPARIHRDGIQLAISTGGANPARARELRMRFERMLSQACDDGT